jgi:hypothetical protein
VRKGALITATIDLQARLITTSLFAVVILITLVTPLHLKMTYLIPTGQNGELCYLNDCSGEGRALRYDLNEQAMDAMTGWINPVTDQSQVGSRTIYDHIQQLAMFEVKRITEN